MFKGFAELSAYLFQKRTREEALARLCRREEHLARSDNKVVGGVYTPEPVNKEAAMLLAKAPWFFHPPQPEPKHEIKKENKEKKKMTAINHTHDLGKHVDLPLRIGSNDIAQRPDGMISIKDIAEAVIGYLKNDTNPEIERLVKGVHATIETLDQSIYHIGESLKQFEAAVSNAVNPVRMSRMTIVNESAQITNSLKDVRQFFIGPNYETERKRLADFVDLCERLKMLKDSGFLDTVADTMIRLASYEAGKS